MSFQSPRRSRPDLLPVVLLLLVLFIGGVASPGFGQAPTGTLTGTVEDRSGAVVPGVAISVTDSDVNIQRTTVTDGTGRYLMPALAPGRYTITAELEGFRRYRRDGVVLGVNRSPGSISGWRSARWSRRLK